ncbi:MAG: hypothetical protein H0W02_11295 [Ktedonobacteraceae bacterium]|nr:hypothetical protein [Ktedonobacteraceae bacterium]
MSLFAHPFVQPNLPHPVIAPHPRMVELRRNSLACLGIAFFGFAYLVFDELTRHVFPWVALLVALIFLLGSGQLIVVIRRYQRIERLRLAAALGDRRLLADRQPQPRLDVLPLPMETALRSPHPPRLMLFIACLVLPGSLVVGLTRGITVSPETLLSLWPWLLLLALVYGVQLAFILPGMRAQRWWLAVTPANIRSQITSMQAEVPSWWRKGMLANMQQQIIHSGRWTQRVQEVAWHEARLFACYPRPNLWRTHVSMVYELSSATDVVSWSWVQRRVPLSNQPLPLVSFAEHHTQVQALCDLVAARTGLPLYDLSKG